MNHKFLFRKHHKHSLLCLTELVDDSVLDARAVAEECCADEGNVLAEVAGTVLNSSTAPVDDGDGGGADGDRDTGGVGCGCGDGDDGRDGWDVGDGAPADPNGGRCSKGGGSRGDGVTNGGRGAVGCMSAYKSIASEKTFCWNCTQISRTVATSATCSQSYSTQCEGLRVM